MNQAEDVEVILAHDRKYKFHASTLARSSTLFNMELTEQNAAKLSNKAKHAGIKIRWLVQLKKLPTAEYPAGRLGLIDLDSTGERFDGGTGMIVNENGRVPTKIFDYYEAVFYAMYGKDIRVHDTDMQAALHDCIGIIQVAEYLGCINIISKPIEVALTKHGQDLFRAIQAMPDCWATMSFTIQSELIFREAIIHLAGNWKRLRASRATLERLSAAPKVRLLAEKYHKKLLTKAKALEVGVASIYPGDMAAPSAQLPIKREEYAKDILVWMALTFFRHWFSQRTISQKGYLCEDGGFALYKALGTAGEAYMDKAVMNQFHHKFPMTKKAMNVLENHLLEIKECVKGVVDQHGVLRYYCQLDVSKYPVEYLTCIEFQRDDLPWLNEARAPPDVVNGVKRGRRPGGNDIAQENLRAARRQQERDVSLDLDGEEEEWETVEENEGSRRARYE